jgi:hypothetical protein
MIKGAVPRLMKIGRFKGNRFIAVCLRQLDAAIPVLMLYIAPAEDDKAGLEVFLIYDECHDTSQFCAESVQIFSLSH